MSALVYGRGLKISQLDQGVAPALSDIFPMTEGTTGPNTGNTKKYNNQQYVGRVYNVTWDNGGDPAFGDGINNDGPAIQRAIDYAYVSGGSDVFFPSGVYRVAVGLTGTIVPRSGITLRGASRSGVIIFIDDLNPVSSNQGISNATGASTFEPISDFKIENLTLKGTGDTTFTVGGQICRIGAGTNITIRNVESRYSRSMGMVVTDSTNVLVEDCKVLNTMRDGIAVWNSSNVLIRNNVIEGTVDDSISCHSMNTSANPSVGGISIIGNHVTHGQGIKVLGAKQTVIANNDLRRMRAYGIFIGKTSVQGSTPQHSVVITGNVVTDVFQNPETGYLNLEQYYLRLQGVERQPGTGFNAPPGWNYTVDGSVVSPFGTLTGAFYNNGTQVTTVPSGGGAKWIVAGNVFARTLPAVAAFSDWGYGQLWKGDRDGGGYYNGPISEAQLNTPGAQLWPCFRDVLIEGNLFQTSGNYGLDFRTASTWNALDAFMVTVRGNKFSDFLLSGIKVPPATQRLRIVGNEFDGDPRYANANRGSGGTWSANTTPVAVDDVLGTVLEGNHFRNVAKINTVGRDALLAGNVAYGTPAAVGFSTSNGGVGNVLQGGPGLQWVIEDPNPSNVTFGQLLQQPVLMAAAQPASGRWVTGTFVENTAPTISAGKVLRGWLRLTTGNGNVAGTDWTPMYSTTT